MLDLLYAAIGAAEPIDRSWTTGDILALIAVVLSSLGLLGGFTLWMTKISNDIGFIRGQLTTRIDGLEKRTDHHSDDIEELRKEIRAQPA